MRKKITLSCLAVFLAIGFIYSQVPFLNPANGVVPAVFNSADGTYDNTTSYYRYEWSFSKLVLVQAFASNDSLGTDHGAAAPMFIFGSKVKSSIYGKAPDIPEKITNENNLQMQTDFRSVYASLLNEWMMLPQEQIKELLYKDFELLSLIRR